MQHNYNALECSLYLYNKKVFAYHFIVTMFNLLQEGAFALAFMSSHFPGECVATR